MLAKKARYFKQDEKGVATMCKMLEDMRNEAAQKAEQDKAKKTAVRLIKLGKMTLEEIAEATELSLDILNEQTLVRILLKKVWSRSCYFFDMTKAILDKCMCLAI